MAKKWERVAENIARHVDSGGLYLRAKVGGKIIERSLETDKVRIAKMKRDVLIQELREESGVDKKGRKTKLTREASLVMLVEHYKSLPNYQEKAANMEYREQTIKVLKKSLPKSDPHRWTIEDIRNWWANPIITSYSATRRNGTLDTLRKLIELLMDRGDIRKDLTLKLKRVSVRASEIIVPTREQFRDLVLNVRDQGKRVSFESANFIEFLAYSGCRISEAREVIWSDVGENFLRVTGGPNKTKNHLSRSVPIIPAMVTLLDSMRAQNDSGVLFNLHSPRFALLNASKRLEFPHFTPHTMRHLFATSCIESGIDIPTVAKWLGHRDGGALAMRTYGHLRDDHSVKQAARVQF